MSITIGINGPIQDPVSGTICTVDVMRDPPLKEPLSIMVKTEDSAEALISALHVIISKIRDPLDNFCEVA